MMTTFGFFSVVQKKGTKGLTVRARVRSDLDRLRERYLPALSPTKATPGNDYAYRATVSHEALGAAMPKIVADVTYDNFKSEVEQVQGHKRELVYAGVWSALNKGLPPLDVAPPADDAVPKAAKYGGVVFDDAGRVLLREPTGHYDGYVWTFAKGDPRARETPQQTALREVREETGIDAEIVGLVPGVFGHHGTTGSCVYFLMRCIAEHTLDAKAHKETQAIRWGTEAEARTLIGQTTKIAGRARDLAVLGAAFKASQNSGRR